MRTESQFETTAASGMRSPAAVSTPVTAPFSVRMRETGVPVRISTPRSRASRARASGTARVPPRGYQIPSAVCMWAIAQRTAGEASGAEPTYCVKWSSIWATRGSGTCLRTVPATVRPKRRARRSPRVEALNVAPPPKVSRTEPTERQKKKRSRDVVQPRGEGEEAPVPRPGVRTRREGVERGRHPRRIGHQVEGRAVVEEAAPLRVEGEEVELALEVAPGLGEDPLQHRGEGEDRRPHVEAEPLGRERRRLAAEPGIALEEDHPVAARRQGDGGGEAAEPGSDDADAIRALRHVRAASCRRAGRSPRRARARARSTAPRRRGHTPPAWVRVR